jgi:hypothetical protein
MLYLFELMANATLNKGLAPPVKELNVCSRRAVETAAVLLRFLWNAKWGRKKMNRRDQELLDKQMRRLTPPRNEGVIAVMLAVMFLVGMTLGSVLSPQQSAPTQIASME